MVWATGFRRDFSWLPAPVLGDAGDALGDSIYEARLFVRGKIVRVVPEAELRHEARVGLAVLGPAVTLLEAIDVEVSSDGSIVMGR